MQIFHFDSVTNEFLSESTANLDPKEGQPMIPGNATSVAAPTVTANQVAVFNGTTWTTEEDHRGSVQYSTTDTQLVEITDIGVLPADVTTLVPVEFDAWTGSAWAKDNNLHWEVIRFERDTKLTSSDWTQLGDAAIPGTLVQWQTYRQELRDIPLTYASDPSTVVWPTEPV